MTINYLHLTYLINELNNIYSDIKQTFTEDGLWVINDKSKELAVQTNLNNNEHKEDVFSQFLQKTGVPLNNESYIAYTKEYYNVEFTQNYNKYIQELFKESEANSKSVQVPFKQKLSFWSKLFKSKQKEIELNHNIYNLSIFNDAIKSKLDNKNEIYLDELLQLNKFIIFTKDNFVDIQQKVEKEDFLKEYVLIKNEFKKESFEQLSDTQKTEKIRELFKNISNKITQ